MGIRLSVKESAYGLGLFADEAARHGEEVLSFRGARITFAQSLAPAIERYCVQVGPDDYLDTEAPEKFINHSCDPNAGFRGDASLAALRDIAPGEEITFDYSTSMDENSWTMECRCGAWACRGVVRDFRALPLAWQVRCLALGAVPPWLMRRVIETMPPILLVRGARPRRRKAV